MDNEQEKKSYEAFIKHAPEKIEIFLHGFIKLQEKDLQDPSKLLLAIEGNDKKELSFQPIPLQ